jgi:hypothetical protein
MAVGMERELLGTGLGESTLVGLLSSLSLLDAPPTKPPFVQGLGQWLGWAEALSLSAALQRPAGADAAATARAPMAAQAERDYGRVVAQLLREIDDAAATDPRRTASPGDADFGAFRQRHGALQQAMQAAIEPLRRQLRAAVAAQSPSLQRLAAIDAVLEQALAAREQALLALMPTLLERHFERLQRAPGGAAADAGATAPSATGRFRQDMQRLLRAELQLRLQPLQGLLEALRNQSRGAS